MPMITYVQAGDGSEATVEVKDGLSVMDGSIANNLPGIVAECGGSCSCATCHVYVDEAFCELFGAASDEEWELLEFLDEVQPNSRLSCQLVVTAAADGLRVVVPENQG